MRTVNLMIFFKNQPKSQRYYLELGCISTYCERMFIEQRGNKM